MNIWTHLLGFVFFLWLLFDNCFRYQVHSSQERHKIEVIKNYDKYFGNQVISTDKKTRNWQYLSCSSNCALKSLRTEFVTSWNILHIYIWHMRYLLKWIFRTTWGTRWTWWQPVFSFSPTRFLLNPWENSREIVQKK